MEERSSGIILRTRPLTETSLIVHWLTRDLGRIYTVARGARRPKSTFVGKLDLFYEGEFSFVRSRRSELHNLREVSVQNSHRHLREEIGWLQQASYFAVLLEKSTETESPIPELHDLLQSALAALPKTRPTGVTVLVFELKLLCLLGYSPGFDALSAAARHGGERSVELSFQDGLSVIGALNHAGKQELNRFLRSQVSAVLERELPERERAVSVASAAKAVGPPRA